MTLLRWDPRDELISMRDEMMRMMNEGFSPRRFVQQLRPDPRPVRIALDAYATDDEIVIVASVPGIKPEAVEVTFEGETLTISGELTGPLENVGYIFQERPHGKFSRSLIVKVPIDANAAEAKFDNGLLTLILPKAEEAKTKVIKINTK